MLVKRIVFIILVFTSTVTLGKNQVTFAVVLLHPYSQLNPQTRECEGQTISKAKEIFAQYNQPMEMLCFPPSRFFKEFDSGKIDVTINIKVNPQLQNKVKFIDPPFRVLRLNLYSRLMPTSDRTIAAVKGFDYGGKRLILQQQQLELLDFPSATSSLQAFLRGKSSKIIFYHPQMDYFVGKNVIQLDDSIQIEKLDEFYTHFAISKQSVHLQSLHDYLMAYVGSKNTKLFIDK